MSPKVVEVSVFGDHFSEVPQNKYSILFFSQETLGILLKYQGEKSRKTYKGR